MTEVLIAAVPVIIGLLTYAGREFLRTKLAPQNLASVSQLAAIAVQAAEQVGGEGHDKLQIATDALLDSAKRVGLKLTAPEASAFIHASLFQMKQALEAPVDVDYSDILRLADQLPEQQGEVLPFPPPIVNVEEVRPEE